MSLWSNVVVWNIWISNYLPKYFSVCFVNSNLKFRRFYEACAGFCRKKNESIVKNESLKRFQLDGKQNAKIKTEYSIWMSKTVFQMGRNQAIQIGMRHTSWNIDNAHLLILLNAVPKLNNIKSKSWQFFSKLPLPSGVLCDCVKWEKDNSSTLSSWIQKFNSTSEIFEFQPSMTRFSMCFFRNIFYQLARIKPYLLNCLPNIGQIIDFNMFNDSLSNELIYVNIRC